MASEGFMIRIPVTWDPQTHPKSPTYDPQATNQGHITTHPNNPPAQQER